MTITAPETAIRQHLIDVLTDEFEPEQVEIRSDKLHESLGQLAPIGAVYPGPAGETLAQGLVQDTTVYVQLFRQWTPEINPDQAVDPADIEEWAERLRRAARAAPGPATSHFWYYRVTRIDYPPDPTGNISRLLAAVTASSQNAALVETTG